MVLFDSFYLPIISILGFINLFLVILQVLTGLHIIKVPFRFHKISGILLLICACAHGALAFFR